MGRDEWSRVGEWLGGCTNTSLLLTIYIELQIY